MTLLRPSTKASRQAWVAATLADRHVRSQEELARLLNERGVPVTQATLSRDLDELGAVRVRAADGSLVYALPGEPGGPGSRPGLAGAVSPGSSTEPIGGAAVSERRVAATLARPSGQPQPRAARGWRGWPRSC